MKQSIEKQFNRSQREQPALSTHMSFADAICEQGYSKRIIQRYFNKLVDKDDYLQGEKRAILQHLYNISF